MNNFSNSKLILEGGDPKLQKAYITMGKEIESALKKQVQIFPQLSVKKNTGPQDIMDVPVPNWIRFNVFWNKKRFIAFNIHVDHQPRNNDGKDLSPITTVGVDGRGIIPQRSKLPDKFEKKFNTKKGVETYMHVKQAIDMALAELPEDEIPKD